MMAHSGAQTPQTYLQGLTGVDHTLPPTQASLQHIQRFGCAPVRQLRCAPKLDACDLYVCGVDVGGQSGRGMDRTTHGALDRLAVTCMHTKAYIQPQDGSPSNITTHIIKIACNPMHEGITHARWRPREEDCLHPQKGNKRSQTRSSSNNRRRCRWRCALGGGATTRG